MSADRVISAAQEASFRPAGQGWTPATIVGHLSMVDADVWLPRIDLMVAGRVDATPPAFGWWEPDAERTRACFAEVTADAAGARLLASRTALLHRLRELGDDDWTAQARHETFGLIDIEGLLLQVLAHDEEHRATLLLGD